MPEGDAAAEARPHQAESLGADPDQELRRLRSENHELRRRIDTAEEMIDELRIQALARRAQVKAMAESLPYEISRHRLLRDVARDAVQHPAPGQVLVRVLRKLGRGPRKAWRLATRKR